MSHLLDRPVWNALTTRHAALAEGGPLAKRYDPSIAPFAAAIDDSAESRQALADLVGAGETILIVQPEDISLPDGLSPVSGAAVVQMIADGPLPSASDARIERLTEADAAEMFALASLTKPGPFSLRAQSLGDFWGVKLDGRLAAMAGERMKQPGFTELSGVCSHPDFRGRGLGRLMSVYVAGRIAARGDTPYLHAYAANEPAIRLYESIGFRLRANINVMLATRPA